MAIDCKTINDSNTPNPNEDCVFPFKYNDGTYYACTTVDHNFVFWCGTDYDIGDGNVGWGHCEEECPKEQGN